MVKCELRNYITRYTYTDTHPPSQPINQHQVFVDRLAYNLYTNYIVENWIRVHQIKCQNGKHLLGNGSNNAKHIIAMLDALQIRE